MSARVTEWPTRVPGTPYLWVLGLASGRPSPRCLLHRLPTSTRGVCDECVSTWRAERGADPNAWRVCLACEMPLHPTLELEGFETCPTCEVPASSISVEVLG